MIIGIDASRANHVQKTGVEWYAFFIIQELKKIIPHDTQVVLYSDVPLKGDLGILPKNWSAKVLHWPLKRFWTQMRMSFEMLFHSPDVLFIPAHVFPLVHPKKTVMTVHDIAGVKFPQSYNWFERWYSTWTAKYAVKKLWQVIVPSMFTKKELCDFTGFDVITSNHIHVVHHGYDETFHQDIPKQKSQDILNTYGLSYPYIMSVGRLEEKKNTWRIVQSFEYIKQNQSYAHFQLLLVGQPGFGYEKVKKIVDESAYKKDILLPGWVGKGDLPVLLQNSKVFVFPSLYEGFGIPVLEAFASGVPVVVSKGSSLEEVGGSATIVVDPFDTQSIAQLIIHVLDNKSVRDQKIREGKERVKNFSWQKSAQMVYEILRKK